MSMQGLVVPVGIVLLQDADFFVDFLSEEGPKGKMIGSFFVLNLNSIFFIPNNPCFYSYNLSFVCNSNRCIFLCFEKFDDFFKFV